MAAGDATWNPKKGVAYRVTFPILDADGDLVTGATGLDPEVSKDGGTFTNATNSVTEIATSSGVYYLDLTTTEMNADTVAVIVKTSSSGAKTTVLVMYPLKDGDITANTTQWGGTTVTGMPMPTYTQPSGFLAATFPTTVASTTNITAASGINIATGGITSASFAAGAINNAAMSIDGSELTAIPWNAAWDAEVESEVQDAIVANHLDHLLAATYDPASPVGVADSLLNDLVEDNGAGTTRFTTTALEQAPAGGGGGGTDWTTDERTQIRQILGVATSGTTPTDPTTGILDTIRDLVVTVDTVADRIEVDTQDIQGRLPAALVSGRIDASVGAMASSVLTASALASDAATEIAAAVRTDLTVELGRIDASISSRMATFTLPTHFSSLEIAANGHVSAVVKSLDNNAITASSIQGGAITAAKFAAGAIDANALATDAATEIATATVGATIEGTETLQGVLRLVRAATVGKLAGAATTTVTIRDAADTKARITATVDADGNRLAVTTDAT
jgi:hypothetical protein